jgi:hypothetical protein
MTLYQSGDGAHVELVQHRERGSPSASVDDTPTLADLGGLPTVGLSSSSV